MSRSSSHMSLSVSGNINGNSNLVVHPGPDYNEVRLILYKAIKKFVGNHHVLIDIIRDNVRNTDSFGTYLDYYSRHHKKLCKTIICEYETITGKVYGKDL